MSKHRNKGSKANRHIGHNPDHYRPAKSKNVVTSDTIVWFGKHKGQKASEVPKDYWVWVRENLNGLAVSPELIHGKKDTDDYRSRVAQAHSIFLIRNDITKNLSEEGKMLLETIQDEVYYLIEEIDKVKVEAT